MGARLASSVWRVCSAWAARRRVAVRACVRQAAGVWRRVIGVRIARRVGSARKRTPRRQKHTVWHVARARCKAATAQPSVTRAKRGASKFKRRSRSVRGVWRGCTAARARWCALLVMRDNTVPKHNRHASHVPLGDSVRQGWRSVRNAMMGGTARQAVASALHVRQASMEKWAWTRRRRLTVWIVAQASTRTSAAWSDASGVRRAGSEREALGRRRVLASATQARSVWAIVLRARSARRASSATAHCRALQRHTARIVRRVRSSHAQG